MTRSTYSKRKSILKKRIKEAVAELEALEKEPIEPSKEPSKRIFRIPQWCKPPWERRDGRQHVVFCLAKRKRETEAKKAWWVFFNGEAKASKESCEEAIALAKMRFCYDTLVWNYEDWEIYKAKNPGIEAKLREIEKKRSETVS